MMRSSIPPEPVRATGEAAQSRQRMRVGMIGLAAVLLLIGLAAAILATANHERQVAAVGAANADVVANMVSDNATDASTAAREPLAELGVAPGASSDANATAAADPHTLAQRR